MLDTQCCVAVGSGLRLLLSAGLFAGVAPGVAAQTGSIPTEDVLQVMTRTDVVNHHVTGPGKAASFNLPGTWLLHEGDVRRANRFGSGWYSDLNLSYRLTNSSQFDIDKLSAQKFEWKLSDENKLITFGDYYANFSQYSMSKSLKGAAFQRNFADDQNYVRTAWGTFDGRWAHVLRKNNADETMERQGGGVRLQRQKDKVRLGFNATRVKDRDDDPRRGAGQDAFNQSVGAFDWEYREPGLLIAGEHALAATHVMPFGAAARDLAGTANKVVFRGAIMDIDIDANLERVAPNYLSLAGGATPDRLRGYLKADARIAQLWKVFGIVDYSRNNLNGQLIGTTYNSTYEAGLTRRRAFDRRTLTISGSLRARVTDTSHGTGNRVSDRVKLRVNDRFFDLVDFRGFIETTIDSNRSSAPTTRAADRLFGLAFDSRHELANKWVMQPAFEVSRQETQNVTAGGSDVFDLVRLGLSGDRGNGTQAGINYEYNTSTVVAVLGNSRRNRFNTYWTTKPAWIGDGLLRFEISENINNFADMTRNYKERLIKATLQFNLDKNYGPRGAAR